jgi:catechol 2,3-dioxygenase-like lactoylglutathione lyase family enzyme
MQSSVLPILKLSFDAVFYYVTDLDRSVDFYRNVLDLRLVSREYVARFDIDGVLFELVPNTPERSAGGLGNARLCLQVADIHDTVAQLQQRRVEVSEVKAVSGGLLAFFKDPDGNELCLWQYTRREGRIDRG